MSAPASARNRRALQTGRGLLAGYLLAGYPAGGDFAALAQNAARAGLDILEIGCPSARPDKDGETIRAAHRAADHEAARGLAFWRRLRAAADAPLWAMGYAAELVDTGFYRPLCREGLIDALVLPDLDAAAREALAEEARAHGVDVLGMVNPNTPPGELERAFARHPLIYQQLYAGPTGASSAPEDYGGLLALGKGAGCAVFAGFGIREPGRVARLLGAGFDGAVVGTALLEALGRSEEELFTLIGELKRGVKGCGN